ncbi:Gp15 family bacteriophage protein [Streptococcus hyointestinalis]|uniref:Phage protein n=1 Tax=Streptococcus hyointestinalis TaxID=1337 RepID=A0A380K8J7_9STRE|nr:Gp15 family bacteriophage protein [Streptococcus hyointestinalis]SUN60610.1 phage protein [Streptococcus hyointestinalis]
MLDLSRKLVDELVLDDVTYPLNLSFNKVLRMFDMWEDDEVPDYVKPHFALRILTGEKFEQLTAQEAMDVFEQVFDEHIQIKKAIEEVPEYDLAGNVMKPVKTGTSTKKKRVYSLKYDGEYIYASFMQAYSIDLFEVQNKLHWKKFNALLAGLPEGTKLIEVVKIRSYEPQKGDTQRYIDDMKELQEEYRLPDD